MKRKTSSLPTRVYKYECGPPIVGAEIVDQQMRAARGYRNALIAIELERRKCYRELTGQGEVAAVETRLAEIETEIEGLRVALKAVRADARSRTPATTDVQARIRTLRDEAKALRVRRKELRQAARQDPRVAFFLEWINGACTAKAIRAARAETDAFWGTYLLVEAAHQQIRASHTDPQFRRWDGSGRVGVQLQGGLAVADMASDTRLRIEPRTLYGSRSIRERKLTLVHLRVGSAGREPIWATWPLTLHRSLPPSGRIKWAWVQRKRIGPHWRWHLCLSVEADWPTAARGPGVVAIDVGWRLRQDRALRVGYWYDDQGEHGEILLEGVLDPLQHADSLQAIRDRNFNETRATLVAWLGDHSYPDWLRAETATLAQWRGCNRLAGLVVRWRGERFDGDADIFAAMEAWRKQDKHLWTWAANEQDKARARRLDRYRNVAADFATRYHTVVLEDFDLRETQRHQAPEATKGDLPQPTRYHQRVANVSELRRCLGQRMTLAKVEAADSTTTCSDCGAIMPAPEDDLMVTCPACRRVWDQDHNSARVHMARYASGPVTPPSGEPLAVDKPRDDAEIANDDAESSAPSSDAVPTARNIDHNTATGQEVF